MPMNLLFQFYLLIVIFEIVFLINIKMKGLSLTVLFLFSNACFAQSDSIKSLNEVLKHKWGCSVAFNSIHGQIGFFQFSSGASGSQFMDSDGNLISNGNKRDNSFSISIVPKYSITNNFQFRFEFGITKLNKSSNYNAKYFNTHQITTQAIKCDIYRYITGIQFNIIKKKWIELYCGVTSYNLIYNTLVYNIYSEYRVLPKDTLSHWVQSKETIPGGLSFGFGGLLGFNVYLKNFISLGFETTSAILYSKIDGEVINRNTSQVIPNPIATTEDKYDTSYKGIQISKMVTSLNISYWF